MLTTPLCRKAPGIVAVFSAICFFAALANAQDNTQAPERAGVAAAPGATELQTISTDSPQDTVATFMRLTGEMEVALLAYKQEQTRANADRLLQIGPEFRQLIDFSQIPRASRRDVGVQIFMALLDIMGRIDLPPLDEIPEADAFDDTKSPAKWRIPGTPMTILRVEEGPRAGEFLFSARTVEVVPGFFQRIQHLPLRTSLPRRRHWPTT